MYNYLCFELKLDGAWDQPGGDKKIFCTADISISWRRNKNLLHITGDELGTYSKLLCTKILERCLLSTSTDGSSQRDSATLQSNICKHKDVHSLIIDLQAGQDVNSIEIQSLSHFVDRLADIISQSGKEMVKNQQNTGDKNPV